MFKNTAAKFVVFAFDYTTGAPKTGDAANLTCYVAKDYGAATVLADTSATEIDATNAKGYYMFDAAQGETNADCLLITAKSSTANVSVIGAPAVIYTRPQTGWLAPATAGRTLNVDANGATLLQTGSGTGQLDFTSGVVKANVTQFNGTNGTFDSGRPEVNATHFAGTAYATALAAEVDAIWDEVLTGASHNVANSAGRRLRILDSITTHDGTAQAGAANSITLAAGASATDRLYNFDLISIVAGTGAGQSRLIVDYNGTSKVATVNRNWRTNPDNTSEYVVTAASEFLIENGGLAAAGAAGSITLNSIASSVDSTYSGSTVMILTGTGAGQTRIITSYNGTTKVATVSTNWVTTPDTTSAYVVIPVGRAYLIDAATSGAAAVRAAVGLASANLDTQLADIPTVAEMNARTLAAASYATASGLSTVEGKVDTVDTVADAIKVVTDQMAFTVAGKLDVNVKNVNDVALQGAGVTGNSWRPA